MAERLDTKVLSGIQLLFAAMVTREEAVMFTPQYDLGWERYPGCFEGGIQTMYRGLVNCIEAEDGSGHSWIVTIQPMIHKGRPAAEPVKVLYDDRFYRAPECLGLYKNGAKLQHWPKGRWEA